MRGITERTEVDGRRGHERPKKRINRGFLQEPWAGE